MRFSVVYTAKCNVMYTFTMIKYAFIIFLYFKHLFPNDDFNLRNTEKPGKYTRVQIRIFVLRWISVHLSIRQ